jgi:WD40-like Beta Propeller Repeat
MFLANADGTGSRKVSVDGLARRTASSPDAGRSRFCVEDRGTRSQAIREVEPGTLTVRRIGEEWSCGDGVWSPKGDVFVLPQHGDLWGIARAFSRYGLNSGERIQLTRGASGFTSPVFSADADRVFTIGDLPRGEIVRYASISRSFVPYLGGIAADDVAFTTDAKWIAYTSYPAHDLWRMKVDGSDQLQITSGIEAYSPRWSPDARRIVFMCRVPGKKSSICLVSAAGGPAEKLTGYSEEESDPDWSPDGSSIAFTTESGGLFVADAISRRALQSLFCPNQRVIVLAGLAIDFGDPQVAVCARQVPAHHRHHPSQWNGMVSGNAVLRVPLHCSFTGARSSCQLFTVQCARGPSASWWLGLYRTAGRP